MRARTPAEDRALLRIRYLRLYAADQQFVTALEEFVVQNETAIRSCPQDGPLPRGYLEALSVAEKTEPSPGFRLTDEQRTVLDYIARLDAFVQRSGLDRVLPDRDTGNPDRPGAFLLHRWCLRRTRIGPNYSVDQLPNCLRSASWEPSPDPTIRVTGLAWDPTGVGPASERKAAEARLFGSARSQIRAEMKRLRAEAIAVGLTFPRSAPNRDRDLGWLYRRAARGETFESIAKRARQNWGTVRTATIRMATRVGVSAKGWENAFDRT